jgi:hypothetical protein
MTARCAFRRVLLLVLLLAFMTAAQAPAAQKINAKTWRAVKTYDMATLQKLEPLPLRQVIGLRFNYRQSDIRHLKPNWFYSSIWSATRVGDRADVTSVPVMVAKADLPAFRRLPTNPESAGKYVAYGQVLRDADANYIFLRLLGTKVKRDARGNATVSW